MFDTRTCRICEKTKLVACYSPNDSRCKPCNALRSREFRKQNATRLSVKQKLWREENPMKTRIKNVWSCMKRRCDNQNNPRYARYGGRGISYCERWSVLKNFKEDMYASFLQHIGENHGNKDTQLERIDNDGNYTPENCKWATAREQATNRRNTRLFELNGEKLTLNEWSRRLGINRSTLSMRYYKYGWDVNRLLTT